jgi:phosphohistidine phosphatase
MKILYLVRHAKSSWDDPQLIDFERPLNPRGEQDAPEMGHRLATANARPDMLVASPAKRAWSTAKIIGQSLGFAKEDIVKETNLYLASVTDIIRIVQSTPPHVHKLMLFGHNPGLTEAVNTLCSTRIENVPTSGIAGMAFPANDWSGVVRGKGELLFFDYPKKPFSLKEYTG